MRPIASRSSGEDAVIIVGKTLRFHEALAATVRTSKKIGVLRRVAITHANQFLCDDRHGVNSAVAEVGDLFWMAESPGGVRAFGGVASVRICSGVSSKKRSGEIKVVDLTGEAAVAVSLKFSIPIFGGKPNFDSNVTVRRRSCLHNDATKGRQGFKKPFGVGEPRREWRWRFEGAGGDAFGAQNFCLRERKFCKGFARGLGVGSRSRCGKKKNRDERLLHGLFLDGAERT